VTHNYDLAIFDLDGTLLNTIDDLAAACNRALRLCGYPEHPVDAYKIFVGDGIHNMINQALPTEVRADSAAQERAEAFFDEYYKDHGQDFTGPYEGILEMLAALKQADVKVAVLSNKPHRFMPALMERYFPGVIDLAFGQREDVPIKPDPTAVHEIIGLMGIDHSRCVYIGDTGTDMDTAVNAKLPPVGVLWGFRTKDELVSHGAKWIINKPMELLEIILDK
jgi:phosphoglycolate phosphatase